ncbi:copper chaperone PCu(A)C [Wenxinia saemankumensis]|uniref:Copper(I)-binding protein n=1 Tax=Wenxinia saemankumensis TaxID=1447782 RepID=A0A1M6G4H9_9RHOB|nr:copper chaperone PCu(A)C [Wenxinia saemankumensis]SHJ04804.1 hypothetical protein SAMN05444417_2675 [Wenxinia saemankumensis]
MKRIPAALAALLALSPALLSAQEIAVTAPFARATLPNQPVAGGFLTLQNHGDAADTLIAATSPAAGRVEIHEMAMEGDVMRMRELPDGLRIPAGKSVVLEPGGYHLMFFELAAPFVAGAEVEVELTFAGGDAQTIMLPVLAPDAVPPAAQEGMDHGTMDHGGMDHGSMDHGASAGDAGEDAQ